MKNIAISLILVIFLALISIGATGSLVTGTSGVFSKVQGEVFQETSSEVTLEDNKLFITVNQKEKENSETTVIECLNFYSEKSLYQLVKNVGLEIKELKIMQETAGGKSSNLFQIACKLLTT